MSRAVPTARKRGLTALGALGAAALLGTGGWIWYLGGRSAPADSPRPAASYVGRATCASCHESEAALWSGSHHDLALQEPTEEAVLGDFDGATLTHFGTTATFFERDGRLFARTESAGGDLADFEIAYTLGAHPLQQYLVEFPGGRYQALGIAWDSRPLSEGGQRWFHLYPDAEIGPDDPLHWTQPAHNWNYMCAECHSTGLQKGYDPVAKVYETTWSEIDVSCEACHGPGSSHVAWAEETARDGGVPTPGADGSWLSAGLADPDRGWAFGTAARVATRTAPLASNEEVETCAQCHARRAILEDGRVAGRPLMDTHEPSLLHEGLYYADGQILDEVYVYGSFAQSRMYRAGVTCSDCHDPHSLDLRATGNALCSRCHLASQYDAPSHHFHPAESPGAQCVECHMPERTYMVVDPRRDHSLGIPRPDLSQLVGSPTACNGCHTEESVEWAAQVLEGWFGSTAERRKHFGEAIHAGRIGGPGADTALVALALDGSEPAIARATALSLLSRYPGGL